MIAMCRNFFLAWLAYWFLAAILPVQSIYSNVFAAVSVQVAFVCLVAFAYALVVLMLPSVKMPSSATGEIEFSVTLIKISLLMSLVGLLALLYDKIHVQGIDFSGGLAVAREAWRQEGASRGGAASSIFSMIGYLFGSSYYAAVVLVITQAKSLSLRQRLLALVTSFVFVMANSAITGGRSNILLLGAFSIGAFSSREDISLRTLFPQQFHIRLITLLGLLAGGYAVFIFYQRAQAGGQEPIEYVLGFLPYLGLEPLNWYRHQLNHGTIASVSGMLVLTASYLTHSLETTAAILRESSEGKRIIFLYATEILHKLGLPGTSEEDWFLAGRFPSVPGAFWYQFGIVGFIVSSLFLGAVSGVARIWIICKPRSLLGLGAYVATEATLLLSPLLLAEDFLGFPFAVISFAMLAFATFFWRLFSPRIA